MIFNKKDIIAFNQQFDTGEFENESSLDFALSYAKTTTAWTKVLAYTVRAILIDHVFQEGNKRTAALLIMSEFDRKALSYKPSDVASLVKKIVTKNIKSIKQIKEMIENAIS